MTAQLSCHVQNFIVITLLQIGYEQHERPIESELQWKIIGVMSPLENIACIITGLHSAFVIVHHWFR